MVDIIETWKDIPNYKGIYQASSLGRIKKINYRNLGCDKVLKIQVKSTGYCQICLHKEGVMKSFIVHRIIALLFIKKPENKPQVNHKNGIKTDNRVVNLEWCTASENVIHAFNKGLRKNLKGVSHSQSKLTEKQVLEIRKIGKSKTLTQISDMYGVNFRTVSMVLNRKRWTHI